MQMHNALLWWCFLLLVGLCYVPTAHAILLANGHVTSTTARILLDRTDEQIGSVMQVTVHELHGAEKTQRLELSIRRVILEDAPQVIRLHDLVPGTQYAVEFNEFDADTSHRGPSIQMHSTYFTTPLEGQNLGDDPNKFVVVSCDRWVDDQDNSHWINLIRQQKQWEIMLHLGDQLYADSLKRKLEPDLSTLSFEDVVQEFRVLYRAAFGRPVMQHVLRIGAHYMLCDDHEIMNGMGLQLLENQPHLAKFVHAGRLAYLEYQGQLMHDLPENYRADIEEQVTAVGTPVSPPVAFTRDIEKPYMFFKWGRVAIAMVDVRYERTFHHDTQAPLVGTRQLVELAAVLGDWDADASVDSIIVATAMPLVFYSAAANWLVDQFESEFYPSHSTFNDTELLLDLLFEQKKLQLFTSGDVHQFAATQICHATSGRCVDHMITSGVTKASVSVPRDAGNLHVFLHHLGVIKVWPRTCVGEYYWQFATIDSSPTATGFWGDIFDIEKLIQTSYFGPNYGTVTVGERYATEITFRGHLFPIALLPWYQILAQAFVSELDIAVQVSVTLIVLWNLVRVIYKCCKRNRNKIKKISEEETTELKKNN